MSLFPCLFLLSFVLADVWQKLKFITVNFIKYVSSFSLPYSHYTWFSCCMSILLLSFHSRHIFESIIFNIEDNVWFRFGGMYIDFYLSVVFCLVPNNNNNVSLTTKIIFKYLLASWEMSFNFLASRTVNTCISLGSLLTWDLAYLQYFFNHLLLFNEKLPQSLTT